MQELQPRSETRRIRAALLSEDPQCRYCGRELHPWSATADHILPLCRGGTTTCENVALACRRCNRFKDWRTPEEFAELLQSILARLATLTTRKAAQ